MQNLDDNLHFDLGLHAEEGTAPSFGFPIFDFHHDDKHPRNLKKRPYKGVDNALQFSRVKRSIDYVMTQFAYGRKLVRISKKPEEVTEQEEEPGTPEHKPTSLSVPKSATTSPNKRMEGSSCPRRRESRMSDIESFNGDLRVHED